MQYDHDENLVRARTTQLPNGAIKDATVGRSPLAILGFVCSVVSVIVPALSALIFEGTLRMYAAYITSGLAVPGLVACVVARWNGENTWLTLFGVLLGIVGWLQFSTLATMMMAI